MAKSAFFMLALMALATACSSSKTETKETSTTVTDSSAAAPDSNTTQMAGDSAMTDTTKRDSIK